MARSTKSHRATTVLVVGAAVFVAETLVWWLRLLPEHVGVFLVSAERLLFLHGPPLALAHPKGVFLWVYFLGSTMCTIAFFAGVRATTLTRRVFAWATFALLWLAWGVVATAGFI